MENTPSDPSSDTTRLEKSFLRLRPYFKKVLHAQGIPADDAEDLLQDAMLAALHKWRTIQDIDAWLVGALKYRCMLYRRSRRKDLLTLVDFNVLESLSPPVPPPQERALMLLDVKSLSKRLLAPHHRAVLKMRYILGYEVVEIAMTLGYSAQSVRKLAQRALLHLRRGRRRSLRRPGKVGPKPAYQED